MGVVLVTGGTRSGKSAVAERLLAGAPGVAYLATAGTSDPEMAARVAAHQARRPASWATIEIAEDPAAALAAAGERPVLLDGLGAWIAGVLHRAGAFEDTARLDTATDAVRSRIAAFVTQARRREAPTVVVVEQAGSAPVGADAGTRRWVDLTGEAAQRLSAVAERALLVVAGRAVELPAPAPAPGLRRASPTARSDERAAGARNGGDLRPGATPRPRPPHGDRMVPDGHEDFAVNVVHGGPPEWLAAVLRDALERNAGRYPDERAAMDALAERHGRPPGGALALNGAAEAFWLLAAHLRWRRPVILSPAFTEGRTALLAHGHEPELVRRDEARGFALDPHAVPDDADLVLLANPCNPTGKLHRADTVAALARPGRALVVDEAFMDLVPGEPESLAPRLELPGLVVVRSLTKSLGIPGLRAGYLLAAPDLVATLGARRQPWSVNALALASLEAWANRPEPAGQRARLIADHRERLTRALAALPGVTVHPGAANFLLLRVSDGRRVVAGLRERRIAVRPTEDLGLDPDHLRVTVRDDLANERLVAALAEVHSRLSGARHSLQTTGADP